MSRLEIILLGHFAVSLADRPIAAFAYDKVRALLAYLAVESAATQHRELVADLLWPGYPERSARQNLSQALSTLRGALDDRDTETPFLLVNHRELQFNPASDTWLDVQVFEAHLQAAQTHAHAELLACPDCGAHLEAAAALYRGDFLADLLVPDSAPFEEWALLKREALRRVALDALERLAESHLQHGDAEAALRYARRQLELDAWREPAHRQVMRALALSGQRNAALAHYEQCRQLLAAELGVEPEAATWELAQQFKLIMDWHPQLVADSPPAPGEPPFKGLQYFDVADADRFFGREALTTRLVRLIAPVAPHDQRAGRARFLAVIGASGSGKSSLVRAGLVATLLRDEVVAGGAPYTVQLLTPTAHPLEALALALIPESAALTAAATLMDDLARDPHSLRLFLQRKNQQVSESASQRVGESANGKHPAAIPTSYSLLPTLLVIDQFEEVFTLCRDAAARRAFIANLLTAAQHDGGGGAFVIITLRADFYEHCAQYPDLREAVSQHQFYIGPLTADGLRHAIEEPARRGGWTFEPGLVDLLLRDVGASAGQQPEPGALPLLSHALLETWRRRRGHTLTLGGYAEAGGVRGAIAQTAEAVYQQFDAAEQDIVRHLFLRLTELGEGTQDTRRRVTLAELRAQYVDAAVVDAVLARLADARLITTEQETAQVAHEALIREWPTLRGWLEADREGLRLHRHLTEAAQAWAQLARDPGELYRGARLVQAAEWAAAHPAALNALEREFLAVSQTEAERAAAEREAQRQRELEAARKLAETEQRRAAESQSAARKLRLRARYLAVTAAGILLVALVAALMWNQARLTAQDNATLAGENAHIAATAVAVGELEAAARVEADEQRIAAENAEHEALLQASVGLASRALDELDGISPERAVLLALAALQEYPYTPQAESALARAVGENRPYVAMESSGGTRYPYRVAWSPDGRYVAAGRFLGADIAVVWDAETGQIVQRFPWDEVRTQQCQSAHIAWSPTGERMVMFTSHETLAMCRTIQIWDVTTGRNLLFIQTDYGPEAFGAGWTPDGTQVFSAFTDGTVKTWNIAGSGGHSSNAITITEHLSFTIGGQFSGLGQKGMVAWSSEGERFAIAAAWQNQAQIVDAVTGVGLLSLAGHTAGLSDITWAPDGARIATSSEDGTVRVWDTTSGEVLLTLSGHGSGTGRGGVMSVAWSPDGARIASTGGDRTVRIWNAANGVELLRYYGVTSPWDVEWSPSSDRLVIRGADEIRVLDMSTESMRLYSPEQSAGVEVIDAQYSPDGEYIVTSCGGRGNVKVWNAYNGTESATLGGGNHVAWAPDNTRIAVGGNPLHVWEVATGELLLQIPTVEEAWFHNVNWSPDGKQVLGSRAYGDFWRVYVFDAATGENLLAFGEYGGFKYAEWSPDGQYIATGCVYSADGNCPSRIWDAQTGETLLMLEGAGSDTYFLEWSPDGKWLATAHTGGIVTVWDTVTGQARLVFAGHDEWITDVTWSPDGTRCASGDVAGTVKGWDAFTGAEVFNFQAPGGVERMDWAPDGAHLVVTGQFDAPIIYRVWQSTADLMAYAHECCVFRALTPEERAQFMLEGQ